MYIPMTIEEIEKISEEINFTEEELNQIEEMYNEMSCDDADLTDD